MQFYALQREFVEKLCDIRAHAIHHFNLTGEVGVTTPTTCALADEGLWVGVGWGGVWVWGGVMGGGCE